MDRCWITLTFSLIATLLLPVWAQGCTPIRDVARDESEVPSSVTSAGAAFDWRLDRGLSVRPPSLADILTPGTDPFHHNPVSWRYLSAQSGGGRIASDVFIAMTTTRERVSLSNAGLLFKLVVEIQGPGPESQRQGESFDPAYQSHVALFTPTGLHMSSPNPSETDLSENGRDIALELSAESPTWPLGDVRGCRYEAANLTLFTGSTRGIVTHCQNYASHLGPANVTTAWVDRVGFVYRSVDPLDDSANPHVYLDFLIDSDLAELAPPPAQIADPTYDFRPATPL